MHNTNHYRNIHREVLFDAWDSIPNSIRKIIAEDVGHNSYEFKKFVAWINQEAAHRYNDVDFPANDPFTFKVSQ